MSLLLVPPLYLVLAERPQLRSTVAGCCLALGAGFVAATAACGIGGAHDLLGMTMLGLLVTVSAACLVALRR
jgi:uncharacterized membrane protein